MSKRVLFTDMDDEGRQIEITMPNEENIEMWFEVPGLKDTHCITLDRATAAHLAKYLVMSLDLSVTEFISA